MDRLDKFIRLNSNEHKNNNIKRWCEDCSKNISDTTRHFQSETHLRIKQNNQPNQQNNFSLDTLQSCPSVQSASGTPQSSVQSASGTEHLSLQFDNNVELIVNENTYIKLKVNPTENLEHDINEIIKKRYFPRFKYQLSYLAKFSKHINGEVEVFKRWVESVLTYNHMQQDVHNSLIQKLGDEQLEGSSFQFQEIEELY